MPRRAVVLGAVVAGVVAADQATKWWAQRRLAGGAIHVIGDDVGFRLSRNAGGAFGIFEGYTPLLAVLAAVLTLVLVRAASRVTNPWVLVALALVLGGALGNLVDRVFRSPGFLRGEVVDFIGVKSFPTFNLADAAVTVGAALFAIAVLRHPS